MAQRDASLKDKRALAVKSRKKDLDDKYLMCNPLPDPENEKDLTTFISLWDENKEKNIDEASRNCQTAEDVVKAIQLILSEALAQYDVAKIKWCNDYIEQIRSIINIKFDQVSAEILTYLENYTCYTEKEKQENQTKLAARGKGTDGNTKPEITLEGRAEDI